MTPLTWHPIWQPLGALLWWNGKEPGQQTEWKLETDNISCLRSLGNISATAGKGSNVFRKTWSQGPSMSRQRFWYFEVSYLGQLNIIHDEDRCGWKLQKISGPRVYNHLKLFREIQINLKNKCTSTLRKQRSDGPILALAQHAHFMSLLALIVQDIN